MNKSCSLQETRRPFRPPQRARSLVDLSFLLSIKNSLTTCEKVGMRFSKSFIDIPVSPRNIRGDFIAFSRFERVENIKKIVRIQKEGDELLLFLYFSIFCKFFFGDFGILVIMERV